MKKILINHSKVFLVQLQEISMIIDVFGEHILELFIKIKIFYDLKKFRFLILVAMINNNHY